MIFVYCTVIHMKKYYFTLPDAVAGNEGANGAYNRLNSGFSGCVETMKTGIENEVRASSGDLMSTSYRA
jgi:hypothetical protein